MGKGGAAAAVVCEKRDGRASRVYIVGRDLPRRSRGEEAPDDVHVSVLARQHQRRGPFAVLCVRWVGGDAGERRLESGNQGGVRRCG